MVGAGGDVLAVRVELHLLGVCAELLIGVVSHKVTVQLVSRPLPHVLRTVRCALYAPAFPHPVNVAALVESSVCCPVAPKPFDLPAHHLPLVVISCYVPGVLPPSVSSQPVLEVVSPVPHEALAVLVPEDSQSMKFTLEPLPDVLASLRPAPVGVELIHSLSCPQSCDVRPSEHIPRKLPGVSVSVDTRPLELSSLHELSHVDVAVEPAQHATRVGLVTSPEPHVFLPSSIWRVRPFCNASPILSSFIVSLAVILEARSSLNLVQG
mmetsp:Transcript_34399/g.77554  ORF Transcript_34399/g.77554 Transcript_34399/m.77554 type:complete len:266 (+) Transcript_34399:491-1288(+)